MVDRGLGCYEDVDGIRSGGVSDLSVNMKGVLAEA